MFMVLLNMSMNLDTNMGLNLGMDQAWTLSEVKRRRRGPAHARRACLTSGHRGAG